MRRGGSVALRAMVIGLCLAPTLAWAVKTDVVVMRNGDRLTGEVKELIRGKLTLKTDDMGTLQIEWDKVAGVTATAPFDIEDLAGHRYVGSLQSTSVAGELQVVHPLGADVMHLVDIVDMQRLGTTFWSRLDGSLDVGAGYASASTLFNLDVSAEVGTQKPGYEISTSGSTSMTKQTSADDTSRSVASLVYLRHFEDRWGAGAKAQIEQNSQLGFDLRSSLLVGATRDIIQHRRNRILTGLGLSLNREQPTDGETTTNVEAAATLAFDRFAYDFPNVDISIGVSGFLSLTDPGRERLEVEGRLQRELVKDFYATLRGYESYDSEPPTEGGDKNDWGLTFALGWSF